MHHHRQLLDKFYNSFPTVLSNVLPLLLEHVFSFSHKPIAQFIWLVFLGKGIDCLEVILVPWGIRSDAFHGLVFIPDVHAR